MPQEDAGEPLLAGRYRLLAQVGHGGMGTVWQAHDEVLGRDVAVKEVILPHGLTDEERAVQYKRTFREARTAARLGHPGVVTVFDVVEEDGRPWIVMELIRSRSLDQVIKSDGPLPPRRAALIGRQMLAALHAAHDAGVLHRDVKPSNVLVGPGDRTVLTDFGIATAQGDATLTQTGLVMGSPAYIAPERARGRGAGPESDLWSLGVTLYAMVDGKSPYERSEPMASLVAVISEDPPPPPGGGPLTPVIEGLLRKDPDERMSAQEAGRLMDEIVQNRSADTELTTPVEAPPAGTPRDPQEPPADATRADRPSRQLFWRPGPGTEPATPPQSSTQVVPGVPGGLSRSRTPQLVLGAVALVAVIALLVFGLNALRGDDDPDGGRAGGSSASPGSEGTSGGRSEGNSDSPPPKSSSAAPSSTPSSGPRGGGVPDGFRLHRDTTGFQIAVPEDWNGPERQGGSVFFRAPDRSAYVQIDQTDSPNPSALADWQEQERAAKAVGRFAGYRRLKLGPTGNHPPVPDTGDGSKSADWEFTWQPGSARVHGLDRGFVTNGHGYAIFVVGPDDDWEDLMEDTFLPVFTSFQPAKD